MGLGKMFPQHPTHLQIIFEKVRHHNMRLNPQKCLFGAGDNKFLGSMNDKLVSLARFLPSLTQKAKHLYKILKKAHSYNWNEECETMFQQLKRDISTRSVLNV